MLPIPKPNLLTVLQRRKRTIQNLREYFVERGFTKKDIELYLEEYTFDQETFQELTKVESNKSTSTQNSNSSKKKKKQSTNSKDDSETIDKTSE